MKILIIGSGAVSQVMTKLLTKEKEINEIIIGSNNYSQAKKLENISKKVKAIEINAKSIEDLTKKAKGVNLIINASLPNFNTNIMQTAINVNSNYQDLCSHLLDEKNPEQLEFNQKFKEKGLVGLINTGVAPGITNLFAKYLYTQLDKTKTIRFILLEEQKAKTFVLSWSPEVTADELSANPLGYENKKFILRKSFGDYEDYNFGKEFGKRPIYNLYGDEVSTLPLFLDIENVEFKSGGSDIEVSKLLFDLGLFSKEKLQLNNSNVSPLEVFSKICPAVPTEEQMKSLIKSNQIQNGWFISIIEALGTINKKKILIKQTINYPSLKEIPKEFFGATYISYPTALAAVSFSRIIPVLKEKGVFPPEKLQTPHCIEIINYLKKHKVKISATKNYL